MYIILPKINKIPNDETIRKFFNHFSHVQIRRKWQLWGPIQKIRLSNNGSDTTIEFIEETLAGKYWANIYNWGNSRNLLWWDDFPKYMASVKFIITVDTNDEHFENLGGFLNYFDGIFVNFND